MTELIEKKIKTAKVVRAILIVSSCILAIAYVGLIVTASTNGNFIVFFPFIFLGMILTIIFFSIYASKYHSLISSVKWLKRNGMENIADDIDPVNPTIAKAKIHCGQNALLCKKPWYILPYSEIAWAYQHESRVNGITVEKFICLRTKSGKKYALNCSTEEFQMILGAFLIRHNPNIILGYGVEQIAKYDAINPNSGKIWKCKRIIPGIILLILSVIMFVASITSNGDVNILGWILPVVALVAGGLLTAIGIRGKKDKDEQ